MNPMPDRVYDILKWIALLVIPTLVGAMVALQEIWSAPIGDGAIATLTGLSSVIGSMLTVSSILYYNRAGTHITGMPVQVYKTLLAMTIYWLPTFATAYYIMSLFMHVHYAAPVVETIVVIQVFLGLILGTYSTQTGDLKYWVKTILSELKAKADRAVAEYTKR